MDKQIMHWIIVLERIKTNLMWTPLDNDPSVKAIGELVKEMAQVQEEIEKV